MKAFDDNEVSIRTCKIIKNEREWRNLTQNQMANELGISQSALCKIENAKMLPTLLPWLRFCRFFDLPSDLPVNVQHYKNWAKRTRSKKKPFVN
jgi:DNA-binding XRE family transcriptional regulator